MNTPVLTIEELHNIESGAWFSKLSPKLQSAILSRALVRRLADGNPLATRGSQAEEWCGVARGAVRISSVSLSGKQITLTYAEPGTWFGDIALFDGLPRTHDADAHGATPHHSSACDPRVANGLPSARRRTKARERMALCSLGESLLNHAPDSML